MFRVRPLIVALATGLVSASCAVHGPSVSAGTPCETASLIVTDDFAGARRGRCTPLSDSSVRLTILPEDDGYINDSAWFAFKVAAKSSATATITLRYRGGHHRYVPKLSTDGINWSVIDESRVMVAENGKEAQIVVPVSGGPLWISGQELITPTVYDVWSRKMAARPAVALGVLGQSRGGWTIPLLTTKSYSNDVILLVGRQHPPEVSGAFAFFAFFETLTADTDLARRFRERVGIIAVPMMNPDGIIGGNWRHNLGGTDLNRDWGPFKQPETQLILLLLDTLDAKDKSPRVFLDFHSTNRNVFYTQDKDNVTRPPGFTNEWLANAAERIENYAFDNDENPTDKPGVSKNYMYHRYGIPASTYEVGDETDRRATQDAARIFAEELMKLMLEQE